MEESDMPNWVYNNLSITGHAPDVQRLKEHVARPYMRSHTDYKTGESEMQESQDVFSFWNCVSPPEEKRDLYWAVSDGSADKTWGWYEWNIANWGTKWDVTGRVELEEHDKDHLQYRMETAWSPPIEAILALSKLFPTLYLELSFEEEQGWGGTWLFHEGVGSEEDSYDIPASHADYEHRDQECACEPMGEPFFDDCPVVPVPETVEV
jgi:hypothetical protein